MPLPIPQQLSQLLKSAKAKASDGLTVPEAIEIVREAVGAGMSIVDVLNQPGSEKKALLLSYLSDLVDFLLEKLIAALPFYARWVAPYFVPMIKQAVLAFADAWLEQNFLAKFKSAA
jgi:hypothetical protein